MRTQRSQRGKEEVLTECSQILAALMQMHEDDLQKLVRLLLVTSIVLYRVCIEGYISVVWKTAPVTLSIL